MASPPSSLRRLDQIGAPVGDPFEHAAHDLGSAGAAGQAEQRAPGPEVPRRRAEPEEGRHEPDVAGRGHRAGDRLGLGRGGEEAEVVPQPLDSAAGREHDGLDAPRDPTVALPRDDREAPAATARLERRTGRADAEIEHAAGAEGDLRQPRSDAALTDERGLLVAGHAGDRAARRAAPRRGRRRRRSRRPSGSTDVGMRRASRIGVVPVGAVGAAQPRDRRVGGVGDVHRSATDSVHATHVSTVPKHRSRRAIGIGHVEEEARAWWPTRSERRGGPGPGAPGTCRRCGGPASRRRARRARRWRGPRRWWTPAGWRSRPPTTRCRPPSMALVGDGQHGGGHRRGIELHEARHRRLGQHLAMADVLDASLGRHHGGADAARADVDDEDRVGHDVRPVHGTAGPNGDGEAQLAGVEDAVRVEGALHRGEGRTPCRAPPRGIVRDGGRCRGDG